MRVAYDAAPLLNPRTGVGHYAAALLTAMLATADVEFELFAITRSAGTVGVPNGPVRFVHLRLPARVVVTLWELAGIPSGERLVGDADVVHGTNFWVPPIRRGNGVVTLHDLTFLLYPELCTPQVQRYRWIVPKVLKRCAAVITPSHTVKEEVVRELRFPREQIIVTPEGVRGAFKHASTNAELERSLGISGDYILFAGTQEPRKNLDRLIEALRLVRDRELRLVIVGPPGWGSVDLPAVAQKLGLEERVIFSGYLTDAELASLMSGARVYLFPSIYEGFGLPPLEAMAAGIPVVASRAGALPEVLGDAPVWCDPLDIDSIAEAIDVAVTDEEVRKECVERGLARASLYEWSETARLTLEAYQIVAGR